MWGQFLRLNRYWWDTRANRCAVTILGADIRELVGPVTLLPATGLLLAGLLAGFLTDYFQPAQRARAARQRRHRSVRGSR